MEDLKLNLSNLKKQHFTHFCILDFEATCEKDKRIHPQEIIEFPTVLLNAQTLQVLPTAH